MLYLQNIAKKCDDDYDDIKNRVIRHSKENGIRVMKSWVIPNRVCDDVVGCKILVPIDQVEQCIEGRCWPNNITCRKWHNEKLSRVHHLNVDNTRGQHSTDYMKGIQQGRYTEVSNRFDAFNKYDRDEEEW